MSTFKKTKVVMLPTKEKAVNAYFPFSLSLRHHDNVLMLRLSNPDNPYCQNQNIYFLSDEAIKEGDWVYNEISKEIYQFKENRVDYEKKIIATTDKSLKDYGKGVDRVMNTFNDTFADYLPQPSTSFIQKFVEEYNKGCQITEVLVEYDYIAAPNSSIENHDYFKLKISKDNTITIRKVKDSWSTEEMRQKLNDYRMYAKNSNLSIEMFDKWIEENL